MADERTNISSDYAARLAAAHLITDPRQRAGAVATIKRQRRAALKEAGDRVKLESAAKRAAVLQSGQAQRPKGGRRGGRDAPKK